MEKMKAFLLVFTGCLLPVCLFAQTVSRKLFDEKHKPLPFGNLLNEINANCQN